MAPLTIPNFKDPKDLTSEDLNKLNPNKLSRKQIEQQGGLDLEDLPNLEEYIKWLGKSKLLEKLGINPADVTFDKFLETLRYELRIAAAERNLSGNWNHIAHNRSIAAGGYPGLFNTSPGFARQNVIEGAKSGINPRLAEEGGFATDKFNAYFDFALSHGNKPYPKLSDTPYDREQHFHRGKSIDALRAATELWRRQVLHPGSPEYTGWSYFEQPWRIADTTQSHGGDVKIIQGNIRNRQGFAPGQAGQVVSPKTSNSSAFIVPQLPKTSNSSAFMVPTQLPKTGPQEKVRLPQTTSVHGPKKNLSLPVTPPQEHLQINPNPKHEQNPLDQVKIPQVLTSIHKQQMNRNPGEGLATLLKILGGASQMLYRDILGGAMP